MKYSIREISENDWAAYWLFCFENRNNLDSFPNVLEGTEKWGPEEYFDLVFSWAKRVRDKTFILVDEINIIGIIRILLPLGARPTIMIVMHYQYRNQNIATEFLDHVMRIYFLEWKRSKLYLHIDEDNIPSRKLFEKFGSRIVQSYVYPNGHIFAGKRYFLYILTNPWDSNSGKSDKISVT